jgi:hypothetical protein
MEIMKKLQEILNKSWIDWEIWLILES